MQNKKIKEKMKNTMMQTHGVENPTQSEKIRKKSRATNLKKYGVSHPMQNLEIALKQAKSSNNYYILRHWKTNKELICIAKYEKATIEYFNKHKINYFICQTEKRLDQIVICQTKIYGLK